MNRLLQLMINFLENINYFKMIWEVFLNSTTASSDLFQLKGRATFSLAFSL